MICTEVAHNVSTHPRVLYLRNRLDITPYMEAATNKLYSMRMPEEYTAAIYRASGQVNQMVSDAMNMAAMRHIKETSNAVYQEVSNGQDDCTLFSNDRCGVNMFGDGLNVVFAGLLSLNCSLFNQRINTGH